MDATILVVDAPLTQNGWATLVLYESSEKIYFILPWATLMDWPL